VGVVSRVADRGFCVSRRHGSALSSDGRFTNFPMCEVKDVVRHTLLK
jgi:hypothetical protein